MNILRKAVSKGGPPHPDADHGAAAGAVGFAKGAAKWLARTAWPWAVVSVVVPAVLLGFHVVREKGGDISGIYYVTPEFYASTVLREVYREDQIQFQEGPYDSVYFLAHANDPMFRSLVESGNPSGWDFHRRRRILFSWAGWLLGGGDPELILYALPTAQLLLLGGAVWALAQLLIQGGRHPGWTLLHVASLGAAVCILRPLADLFAVNLLLLGCCAWHWKRISLAVVCFAAAALTKESSLLVPAVLAATSLARGRLRETLALGVVPLAMLAWWVYAWMNSTGLYFGQGDIGRPFEGILDRLLEPLLNTGRRDRFVFWAYLIAMASVLPARPRYWDEYRWAVGALVLLALHTQISVWADFWSYGRVHLAIPTMALFCFAVRGRWIDLLGPAILALAGLNLWRWAL